MVCIYCGKPTSVVNSRPKKNENSVWRRRQCSNCQAILTTFEQYDLSTSLLVKKRSQALQSFERDKLLISIAKAIDHKKNSNQTASFLTNNIINLLLKSKPINKIISTQDISNMTFLSLKRYDPTSAIKYLSFQQQPSARELKKML